MAKIGRASQTVTWKPMNEPTRATAAAKSMAPKTSIRGGGAIDSTSTATSSIRRSPSGPRWSTPVDPAASKPRASSITASSSRSLPSEPDARSGQTTNRAPSRAGEVSGASTTVATATGSWAATDAAMSAICGKWARSTGSTRMSITPPQVSPTEKASSSLTP